MDILSFCFGVTVGLLLGIVWFVAVALFYATRSGNGPGPKYLPPQEDCHQETPVNRKIRTMHD